MILKRPTFITFTGIDEQTNLAYADFLASKYPIEWGILVTENRKSPRYPNPDFISKVLSIRGAKSLHLCLDAAKAFQTGLLPDYIDPKLINRVQVNGFSINTTWFKRLETLYGVTIILQHRDANFTESEFLQLYDRSGGRGIFPEHIPPLPHDGRLVGYSGGICATNIHDYLAAIQGSSPFWIDIESGVRTNDAFDLNEVEHICQLIYSKR